MNKKLWIGALLAACLIPLGLVKAAETGTGTVYVAKDEIVSGNLYAAGETVTIDGTVSGDLIAVSRSIRVTGRVEGDVIAAAQDIIIDGAVGGNVRIAGSSLTINGSVARNVNTFGSLIILGPSSRVGWDVFLAGETGEVRGSIDGGLSGSAGRLLISGQIGKDANLRLEPAGDATGLTLSPTAIIKGSLSYTSEKSASIAPGASVQGETKQNIPAPKDDGGFSSWIWGKLFAIFAALLTGLALIFLSRGPVEKITDSIKDNPVKTMLPGLIVLLVMPPLALILMATIIGLPLAIITLVTWLIIIYFGKIMAAISLGRAILGKTNHRSHQEIIWSMVIGIIIIWLLAGVPYIGWLFGLAAAVLGIGGIWNYAYRER